MRRDVDDIVTPAHDVDIPILVDHAGVACVEPFAVEAFEVASVEARIVVEQGRESRRGQGHGEHDIAHPALLDLVAFIVDDAHIESGHRLACAARLDGQRFVALPAVVVVADGRLQCESCHRTAGLARPPVVNDPRIRSSVLAQEVLIMRNDRGLGSLACEEQAAPVPQLALVAVPFEVFVFGVFLANGPQRRGSREQCGHFVFVDHAPERARVGRANRLALIQDCRGASK